jgi:hypothetical protein
MDAVQWRTRSSSKLKVDLKFAFAVCIAEFTNLSNVLQPFVGSWPLFQFLNRIFNR